MAANFIEQRRAKYHSSGECGDVRNELMATQHGYLDITKASFEEALLDRINRVVSEGHQWKSWGCHREEPTCDFVGEARPGIMTVRVPDTEEVAATWHKCPEGLAVARVLIR